MSLHIYFTFNLNNLSESFKTITPLLYKQKENLLLFTFPHLTFQNKMEADTQELTKLPIKRTDENDIFKLPHPSAAPFMKRRKQHEKKYDEELLLKKFGSTALKNIIVNDNYIRSGSSRMSGFTWQFLKKDFVLPLNLQYSLHRLSTFKHSTTCFPSLWRNSM